jgi:hypothetical protein
MTTPQKALEKWKSRMQASVAEMKDGVNAVQTAPTAAAAAAADKWLANVTQAKDAFVAGCNDTSLQDWKSAMLTKGAQNMTTGVRDLSPRAQKAMSDLINFSQQVSQQIQSMPNTTESDADARMLANVAAMRAYRKGRR